jgi:Holliday junction DNA helicase RuvB
MLLEALDNGTLSLDIGSGPATRRVTINLPQLVIVAATAHPDSLSQPVRDRFSVHASVV